MVNRVSRVEISIPKPSYDGRYYGRYPNGNAPPWAATPSDVSSAVAALTSGGGGGSLTSLGTLVNGMTAGTWAVWSGGFMASALTNPAGNLDPVISNGTVGNWDPTRNWFSYYGHGHTGDQSLQLDFIDATSGGGWINTNPPALPAGSTDTHQFFGQTIDPVIGDLWFWPDNGPTTGHALRRTGTTWNDIGDLPQGDHSQLACAAFNPFAGTAGNAYFASWYGIDRVDASDNSIHQVLTNSQVANNYQFGGKGSPFDGGHQGLGFRDVAAQAVFFISAAASGFPGQMIKISSSHVVTQMNALPVTNVDMNQPSAEHSYQPVDGYVSTSTLSTQNTAGTVRKPLIFALGGGMYKYDSSTDTWTLVSGVTCPDSTSANYSAIYGVCPKYDCVLLFVETDTGGTGAMTAYVYKRSPSD